MTDTQLLTPEQLAERWQVDVETVRRWCRSGVLPSSKIGGLRIHPDDAEAFRAKRGTGPDESRAS